MRRFLSSILLTINLLLSADTPFGCFLRLTVNGPFGPFSIIGAVALRFASLRRCSERRGNTAWLSRGSASFPNRLVLVVWGVLVEHGLAQIEPQLRHGNLASC